MICAPIFTPWVESEIAKLDRSLTPSTLTGSVETACPRVVSALNTETMGEQHGKQTCSLEWRCAHTKPKTVRAGDQTKSRGSVRPLPPYYNAPREDET